MRAAAAALLAAAACAALAAEARAGCAETEDPGALKAAAALCSREMDGLQASYDAAVAAKDLSAQNAAAEKMGADLYTYRKLEANSVRSLKDSSLSDEQGVELRGLREGMDRYLSEHADLAKIASTGAEPPPSLSQDDEALLAEPRADGDGSALEIPGAPPAAKETGKLEKAGDDALSSGRIEQARADYQRAARESPKDAAPLLRLAALSEKQGDVDAAKGFVRQALQADPTSAAAKIALGHADELEAARSRARATSPFEKKRAEQAPGGAGDAGTVAIPRDLSQDYASALAALSPRKSPALSFILAAERKRALGDRTAALLAATQAIDADRGNAAAWTIRADVDNDLKNYEGAINDASQALALQPEDAQALRARAYALYQLGRYQEAYADIVRASEMDRADGTGWLYRAMIEEKLGQLDAAKKHYLKAEALDPALKPLAEEALARLGLGASPAGEAGRWAIPRDKIMRGGAIAISLLFVILGLLGTGAGRAITTTARRGARAEARAETVLDEPAQALAPGAVIGGHYRIERELGRGGMGVVYAASDQSLERPVAIKRLQRDAGATSQDLERFMKEARLVAKLRHPNIAEIYAVLERPELLLVFEYIEGRPLDGVLSARGRLPGLEAARIVDDVCAALAYAHERKIIHRDLKPSNVMVAPDGSCKVMDFGIAHQARSGATFTQTIASGTPPYMAPEQMLGSNSQASDLYALGAMAYELLAGVRPFEGPDYLEQKLQKRYRRDQAFSPALSGFFETAFEPDPTRRHGGAAAFARAFRAALA